MRSPRVLYLLTALALLSVAAVFADLATDPGTPVGPTRLFPGFEPDSVTRIRWSGGGAPEVVVERRDGELILAGSPPAPVRDSTLRAFLGAVQIAEDQGAAVPEIDDARFRHIEIHLEGEGAPLRFSVAPAVAKGSLAVLELGDTRVTVPAYLGRELALAREDLRSRRPFAALGPGDATGYVIGRAQGSAILEGPPWQVVAGGERGRIYADPDAVAEIARLVRALRYDSWAEDASAAGERLFYIRARAGEWIELEAVGRCPGGYLMRSELGLGCIDGSRVDAVLAAGEPERLYDRHLVAPGRRAEVEGAVIEVDERSLAIARTPGGGWEAGGEPVAPEAVIAWLRRLDDLVIGAPAMASELKLEPAPWAVVTLSLAGGEDATLRFRRGDGGALFVQRGGEDVLWPVAAGAIDVIRAEPAVFAGLELIEYSSHELASARLFGPVGELIDGIERGETLGEWRAIGDERAIIEGAGAALAQAVGYLRAEGVLTAADAGKATSRLELSFFDPAAPGGRSTVTLGLGGAGGAGERERCTAELKGARYLLGARECRALTGPWTRRK